MPNVRQAGSSLELVNAHDRVVATWPDPGSSGYTSGSARADIRSLALGYYAESSPLTAQASSTILASQLLRATAIGLRAGDVVTNIVCSVNVVAAGTAGVINLGLYSSAYAKLASTGDVNASFTSLGPVVAPLTAPYVAPADDVYYAVICMTTAFGTTQPTLIGANATGSSVAVSGRPRSNWLQGSQASLPATATPADTSASFWFGIS